jgi:hypothetical protein
VNPPRARWHGGQLAALVAEGGPPSEPSAELIEAYDAGAAAYRAGEPTSTIPANQHTPRGIAWLRGYCRAQLDDQYGPIR